MLTTLSQQRYFATLDLKAGFRQIEMDEESCAMRRVVRIPSNAFRSHEHPSTFQRAMDSMLNHLHRTACLWYLDDPIVFGKSTQELARIYTRSLGALLIDSGMAVNTKKCKIGYYRRFLPNLSDSTRPLKRLARENQGWKWETGGKPR